MIIACRRTPIKSGNHVVQLSHIPLIATESY